jgi:hypothetical protein
MAELLILEFAGVDESQYNKVNDNLGLSPGDSSGDWPEGLTSHTGATTGTGLIVVETWESREAQDRFMTSRLGPAIQAAGITGPPTRVEWATLIAHVDLG